MCTLAIALLAPGSYTDIFNLRLKPEIESGVLRYVDTFHFLKCPPIPAVKTIVGALLILLTSAVSGFPLVSNLGVILTVARGGLKAIQNSS
jgi:hypothetical protein